MNGYWPLQQSLQQSLTVAVDSESESQKEVQNLETIGVPFQDELFVPTKQRSQRNRDANSEQNISNALVYKFKDTSAAGVLEEVSTEPQRKENFSTTGLHANQSVT